VSISLDTNAETVASGIEARCRRAAQSLGRGMLSLMVELARYVTTRKLLGQVLNRRTGNLFNSVQGSPRVEIAGSQVTGTIGTDPSSWYGTRHEFGGTFEAQRKNLKHPPHLLRGRMTGSPYTLHFPERSWLRSSLAENREKIIGRVRTMITEAMAS
jgi:hypothetical protein